MMSLRSVVGVVRAAVVTAAVLLCAVGIAPEARAQRGMMGQFDIGTTPISKRSLEDYARILGMDETQKEAATDLLTGYRDQLKTAREARDAKIASVMEDARDSGDWMGMQKKMQEEAMKFRDDFHHMEETFATDVKALLTEKQLEKWSDVERYRRRDLTLRFQFYTGGAVDIVQIATRSGTALDTPEYKEVMSQYETQMDTQLKDWERMAKDAEDDMKKNPDGGPMAMQKVMTDLGGISKQIRDINKDFAGRVMGMLNEDQKAKFETAFNERAYPRVYKKVYVVEKLDAASKLEGLDTTQKETITTLRDQWTKESKSLNAAWATAIAAEEDENGGVFGSMMKRFGGGNGDDKKDNAVKQAREARKALEDRISKRLDEVLSPQQKESLPKRKVGEMDMFGGMFGDVVSDEDE